MMGLKPEQVASAIRVRFGQLSESARAKSQQLKAIPARHWKDAGILAAGVGTAAFFMFGTPDGPKNYGVANTTFDLAGSVSALATAPFTGLAQVEAEPDQAEMKSLLASLKARGANEIAPAMRALTVVLKPGDTLAAALDRAGAPMGQVQEALTELAEHMDLRKLRPGQKVNIELASEDNETRLNKLAVLASFDKRLVVERSGDDFNAKPQGLSVMPVTMAQSGTINGSLFYSAMKAGVPESVVADFVRIFAYEVDFERDIHAGDRFTILYDRAVTPETENVQNGPVLYGRLELGGKAIELYRLAGKNGTAEYFKADGSSVRKLLMKTPIDGARMTSNFGMRRHPVLGYNKMHKGVDFGAGTGTPILAAGSGTVEMAGRWGAYGNYVRIRHNNQFKTAYAHMSRYAKGVRTGARVTQGQVIGYVGATGRVTGAHLHYEVLKGGTQVNPNKLQLTSGRTLKGKELNGFKAANRDRLALTTRILEANRLAAASTRPLPERESAR